MRIRSTLGLFLAAACLVTLVGVAGAAEKAAKPKPSGTMSLSAKALAAGAGYSWGDGKLMFGGKSHAFSVDGLTVGSVGASQISAKGSVYHLTKLEDFNGTYTAVVGGATVGGGGGGLIMQNQNGVEVRLHATTKGLSLTAGVSGVTLSLK